ncbi:hypothetical protein DPMN_069601 [Dreissena polymorpha]|uniref:HECT domain-containing protein n=1 Tax=Dreissena polymorpha TaxID=45954 RepID=A0A9D4BX18_DREPO|nr:hypothetical protein DPMN_069601 [Dreissena polymorpha]
MSAGDCPNRSLEIEDTDTSIDGQTTFITVNRDNVLVTSLEEISGLTPHELRHTLEVQFYNEVYADYGGPRKEFFRLVLQEIKEKYFDNGIRDLLHADYYHVGILMGFFMFLMKAWPQGDWATGISEEMVKFTPPHDSGALSILHNGKMPVFLKTE